MSTEKIIRIGETFVIEKLLSSEVKTSFHNLKGGCLMKKIKKISIITMSAALIVSASAAISANAGIDVRNADEVTEVIQNYTRIEDPSGIEWQGFEIEKGSEYYVNEYGAVVVLRPQPNSIVIEIDSDMNDGEFYEIVNNELPDAQIIKSNGSAIIQDIKSFEILDKNVSVMKAKEIYSQLVDSIKSFKYTNNMYKIGNPQYNLSQHEYFREIYGNEADKSDFTLYSGLENEEALKAFINENNLPCHIVAIEKLKAVDVVPDENIGYNEEINIASQIYHSLGLKPGFAVMATESGSSSGTEIDLYNSVQGDANCDGKVNMGDVVLIMQSIANPDKYGLNGTDDTHITAQGSFNADMNDDGITTGDALTIQKMLLDL